jgi:hypothetical protein
MEQPVDRKARQERDDAFRAEAERLAQLSVADQQEILALYRQCAANPKVPRRERVEGLARVAALQQHLRRLNRKKKPK